MSLATNVNNLATRVATEAKALRTLLNGNAADNSALLTTAKSNLIAAINELYEAVSSASGIDDGATSTSSTWSSSKISGELAGKPSINDTTASGTSVYSSNKVNSQIAALLSDTGTAADKAWSSSKTNSEIGDQIAAATAAFTEIDDTTPSATSVYSSSKTDSQIGAAITALVDGAPTALDTLHELADALSDQNDAVAAITLALDNRVRVDAAQTFNSTQQAQGRANISAAAASDLTTLTNNVGDTTIDFATTFANGLSS